MLPKTIHYRVLKDSGDVKTACGFPIRTYMNPQNIEIIHNRKEKIVLTPRKSLVTCPNCKKTKLMKGE